MYLSDNDRIREHKITCRDCLCCKLIPSKHTSQEIESVTLQNLIIKNRNTYTSNQFSAFDDKCLDLLHRNASYKSIAKLAEICDR